jgi:hypothetical protein
MAVMAPWALHPARSMRRGSRAKTLGAGRLAHGQADLALGHGKSGHRVHHQQHALALVAEMLGDGRGGKGGLDAEQGRLIAGGADHDAFGHALFAQLAGDEFAHFAASLADEGDDVDVGQAVPGDHAQQGAFADSGAGEDAHALAFAHGEHAVNGADSGGEGALDEGAVQRGRRGGHKAAALPAVRFGQAVQHAAQKLVADGHAEAGFAAADQAARTHALHLAEGHQEQALAAEPHHLAGQGRTAGDGLDQNQLADAAARAIRLDDEAHDFGDSAQHLMARSAAQGFADAGEFGGIQDHAAS